MASLIPDSVADTFADIVDAWGQIESIKVQKRLAEARASLQAVSLPTYPMDAQAKAGAPSDEPEKRLSTGAIIGIGLIGVVALVMILKD